MNRGYGVAAADGRGPLSINFTGAASSLIAVRVMKEKIVPTELLEDVKAVLAIMDAKYNSIVISEFTMNCTWSGTNIVLSPETIKETKQVDKKAN